MMAGSNLKIPTDMIMRSTTPWCSVRLPRARQMNAEPRKIEEAIHKTQRRCVMTDFSQQGFKRKRKPSPGRVLL